MNLRRAIRELFGKDVDEQLSNERQARQLLLDRRSFLAGSLAAALLPAPKTYSFARDPKLQLWVPPPREQWIPDGPLWRLARPILMPLRMHDNVFAADIVDARVVLRG